MPVGCPQGSQHPKAEQPGPLLPNTLFPISKLSFFFLTLKIYAVESFFRQYCKELKIKQHVGLSVSLGLSSMEALSWLLGRARLWPTSPGPPPNVSSHRERAGSSLTPWATSPRGMGRCLGAPLHPETALRGGEGQPFTSQPTGTKLGQVEGAQKQPTEQVHQTGAFPFGKQ